MHAVKPHRVSRTRLRCQAIIVLISLQLCLINCLEARLHTERPLACSKGIYNHVATLTANGDIRLGRERKNTFDSIFTHSAALNQRAFFRDDSQQQKCSFVSDPF